MGVIIFKLNRSDIIGVKIIKLTLPLSSGLFLFISYRKARYTIKMENIKT